MYSNVHDTCKYIEADLISFDKILEQKRIHSNYFFRRKKKKEKKRKEYRSFVICNRVSHRATGQKARSSNFTSLPSPRGDKTRWWQTRSLCPGCQIN